MTHSFKNSARSSVTSARAKAARLTAATRPQDNATCFLRRLALILSLMLLLPLLSSCSDKATYIRGDKGSSGQINVSPITGTFSVIITGPYEYCSLPGQFKGNAQEVCLPHHAEVNP